MLYSLSEADSYTFEKLGWLKQLSYLGSLTPIAFQIFNWINNIWTYSEFIVLLTNERKRALHDYMAKTVIVKAKYIDQIREYLAKNDKNDIPFIPETESISESTNE